MEKIVIPAFSDAEFETIWKRFLRQEEFMQGLQKEKSTTPDTIKELKKFAKTLADGEIPKATPKVLLRENLFSISYDVSRSITVINFRSGVLRELKVFSNVTQSFAKSVKKELPDATFLDPLAGRGYLAKALQEEGLQVIATDNNSWGGADHLENLDALDSIEKYGDQVTHVIISWPPYDSPLGAEILKKAREKGLGILYIGEGEGGCTADDEFHNLFQIKKYLDYDTMESLHDFAAIGS